MIGCTCPICRSADPKDKRLRSSILVRQGEFTVVVDTGPDFRQQMLNEQVLRLDAVLFTHEHRDHTAGLDEVRSYNFLQQQPMDVYASKRVQENLKRSFAYIFENQQYPGVPKVDLHTISAEEPFRVGPLEVVPIHAWHYKLPVLGFRFGDFTYITDANEIPPQELEKVRGTRVLVLNALRFEEHISHFTVGEALELVEELQPETAFFTHLSHQIGFHQEVEDSLPDHVHLAYDGLKVNL